MVPRTKSIRGFKKYKVDYKIMSLIKSHSSRTNCNVTSGFQCTFPFNEVFLITLTPHCRSLSEDALAGLESSLEHLDLSGNGLESIPEAVLALPRLSSLDLAGNAITTLPDGSAFNHLNALLSLDLSDNLLGESNSLPPNRRSHLSLLSFNLEPLTDTLQELNLRGNGFRGLPKQLEDRKFARLRRLDLSNNPLGGE